MTKKAKAFDCVEMKRRAQEEILSDYEARKTEFRSYANFLQSRSSKSAWQSALLAKLESGTQETTKK